MMSITLKKPVQHEGKTFSVLDIDPSLGALEDFEAAVKSGANELAALRGLITADGDIPDEVARQIRLSDLMKLSETLAVERPTSASSATGEAGEAAS